MTCVGWAAKPYSLTHSLTFLGATLYMVATGQAGREWSIAGVGTAGWHDRSLDEWRVASICRSLINHMHQLQKCGIPNQSALWRQAPKGKPSLRVTVHIRHGRGLGSPMGWVGLGQATCLLRFSSIWFWYTILWSWIRIGFQTRCVNIQVVAIASLTSTFYSCSLVTSLLCMTVAASCILCLKLACMKTNENIYFGHNNTSLMGWVDKNGPMSMSGSHLIPTQQITSYSRSCHPRPSSHTQLPAYLGWHCYSTHR